ncbi:hypothetical protein F5888DRAFT_1807046 [Russula emetica]|nr:hypothetical protein F5888DRAFT_1807046 [Russula emetica]
MSSPARRTLQTSTTHHLLRRPLRVRAQAVHHNALLVISIKTNILTSRHILQHPIIIHQFMTRTHPGTSDGHRKYSSLGRPCDEDGYDLLPDAPPPPFLEHQQDDYNLDSLMQQILSAATVTAVGLTFKAYLNSGLCSISVHGLPYLLNALHSSKR